ncbi:hypothetical protein [Meiothermus sp.]|jgi:hypothetical protein|uniref:hypothetical protein n=1 Tax=Meiothermus sp. TaxID=1955249 RepID=UPI0021DBB53E|nr:hypothetical protein [Meiothermus sp.]GIW25274.1 MAG: hypothetical protein KatS3mg069_1541 [Meiothermus sp.]
MNETLGRRVWRHYRVHIACFVAGVLVGVMFGHWLRGIVTVLWVAGILLALYWVWGYFNQLKKQ